MKKIILAALLLAINSIQIQAQEATTTYAHNTFEGTRVVVGHSVEMLQEGEMDFLIGHKFGRLNGGFYELFGLDQAIIRIGLDYAPTDWLNVGVGRSSLDKVADGFLKFRLLRQQKGQKNIPISASALATMGATMLRALDPAAPIAFQNRLSYTYQLILARQFNERFSLQLTPTLSHFNLVDSKVLPNDVIVIGTAAKYQLSKAVALKAEYYYALPNQLPANRMNSLAIGVDLDTGSHVFQLHLSNSGGLVEPAFIGNTTGDWFIGDIHFGFTMSRVFKLKGRRY